MLYSSDDNFEALVALRNAAIDDLYRREAETKHWNPGAPALGVFARLLIDMAYRSRGMFLATPLDAYPSCYFYNEHFKVGLHFTFPIDDHIFTCNLRPISTDRSPLLIRATYTGSRFTLDVQGRKTFSLTSFSPTGPELAERLDNKVEDLKAIWSRGLRYRPAFTREEEFIQAVVYSSPTLIPKKILNELNNLGQVGLPEEMRQSMTSIGPRIDHTFIPFDPANIPISALSMLNWHLEHCEHRPGPMEGTRELSFHFKRVFKFPEQEAQQIQFVAKLVESLYVIWLGWENACNAGLSKQTIRRLESRFWNWIYRRDPWIYYQENEKVNLVLRNYPIATFLNQFGSHPPAVIKWYLEGLAAGECAYRLRSQKIETNEPSVADISVFGGDALEAFHLGIQEAYTRAEKRHSQRKSGSVMVRNEKK